MNLIKNKFASAFNEYPFETITLIILVTLFIVLFVDYRRTKKSQINRQISSRIGKAEGEVKKRFSITELGIEFIEKKEEQVRLELEKANVLFTTQEYFTFMTVGMGIGALIGLVMFPLGPLWTALVFLPGEITKQIFGRILAAIVFSGGGYFFPKLWLKFLISRRRKMIADQLQDALLNIADALKSGHVIQEAIRIVGTEMPYPIGMEFEKTHREMEAGKTLNQALTDMKKRISLPDFDMAVSAMEIQFEVGGKLEPLLRNMVRIINERADLRKEIEKTIAGSKTVGIVLLSAPIFFVVTFTMLQKNTYIQMFHSGFGIIMIIVAIICYIIAAIIIFAIIKSVSEDT